MRLHTLIPALLALSACDLIDPKPVEGDAVVAKAPAAFTHNHENHVLAISVGSLVARSYPQEYGRETKYTAPYSIFTHRPFTFKDEIILTCDVYDGDSTLVGGAGLVVDRAPTGGIVEFRLTHLIEAGRIVCRAASGEGFTRKAFP